MSSKTWQISAGIETVGRLFQHQSSLRHYLFVVARTVIRDYWSRLERSKLRSSS